MDKFVIVNGGTQKQRWLVEDIAWWFCTKYFKRFKSIKKDSIIFLKGHVGKIQNHTF